MHNERMKTQGPDMEDKRTCIQVRVTPELRDAAKKEANRRGTDLSEVIRAYLKRYVAAKRKDK